jgi:hypothetical protein
MPVVYLPKNNKVIKPQLSDLSSMNVNSASAQFITSFFLNRDITIEINGLGILDWLVSSITTWIVALFNEQIISSLDGNLQEYVAEILPLVDPTQFFG